LADTNSASAENSAGSGKRVRIGLISPYTGGNLGDAAIIESARAHLRHLFQEAEFLLIVLDCDRVSRLHGLECFPLATVKRSFYFTAGAEWSWDAPEGSGFLGHNSRSSTYNARCGLKKVASFIPFALPLARRLRDASRAVALEERHLREVGKVLRSLDGLVVAGGGQFDDQFGGAWGHPYSMFKWISKARREGVPVFFAGVGVCEVSTKLTGWFLRRTIAKSRHISLRDEGSIEILRRVGVSIDLRRCPDLAFGLPDINAGINSLDQGGSRFHIGFSPIAFGRPGSWPTENTASFDRYWDQFRALGADLIRAGYRVTVFATDDSDVGLAKEIYEHFMESVPGNEQLRLLSTSNLAELLCALPGFDAVIAGRLHGVLLSHVAGVPVVAISYHRKVRAHMEDMGQQKFCLDFERFDAQGARGCLTDLLAQRADIVTQIMRSCAARYKAVQKEFAIIGEELFQRRGNP
jgi:polysaccharide pyruvyl transferase WcaK-like protein